MKRNVKQLIAGTISAAMILSSASVFAEVLPNGNNDTENTVSIEQTSVNAKDLSKDVGFVDYSVLDEQVELNAMPVKGVRYYFKGGSSGSYFYIDDDTLYIDATKSNSDLYNSSDMTTETRKYWSTLASNSKIKNVVIDNVAYIPKGMFTNFHSIEEVSILCDIKFIGISAFANCWELREVYIDSMHGDGRIYVGAFEDCKQLERIYLPEGLKIIGQSAFTGTAQLKDVVLPETVKRIAIHAFSSSGLKSINIPESVVDIGTGAFMDTNLSTINIPETVKNVYCEAFSDCENLKTVYISSKTKFGRNGGLTERSYSYGNGTLFSDADIYVDGYKEISNPYGDDDKVHYSKELRIDSIPDQYYYGAPIEPDVTVKLVDTNNGSSVTLIKDTDYRVSYTDNNAVGEATVNIMFIGDYGNAPDTENTFNIFNPELEIEPIPDQLYVGNAVCPKVVVNDNSTGLTLSENIDYTVSYSQNTGVGTGIANISYINKYAGYTGDATSVTFNILEWDISIVPDSSIDINDVEWIINDVQYNPNGFSPDIIGIYTISIDGAEYKYTLQEDIDYIANFYNPYGQLIVGDVSLTVSGIGKFTGDKFTGEYVSPYYIQQSQFADGSISCTPIRNSNFSSSPLYYFNNLSYTYTGEPVNLSWSYAGSSYTILTEEQEVQVGSATFENIYPFLKISNPNLTLTSNPYSSGLSYGGGQRANSEYIKMSYENNVNAGQAYLNMTAGGYYTGSYRLPFTINPANMSTVTAELISKENDLIYIGNPVEAEYKLTLPNGYVLVEGTDYIVSYQDNDEPGTAIAVVTGKGNFTGELRKEFTIRELGKPEEDIDLEFASLELTDEYTYDGEEKQPKPVVNYTYVVPSTGYQKDFVLEEGEDYTLRYENNINASDENAHIILEPIEGRSKNERDWRFSIFAADISDVATQDISDQFYTGDEVEPELNLSFNGMNLVKDTDYEVVFENNETVGTATATIYGIGNYSGEISKDFNIIATLFSADTISIADIPDEEYNRKAHTPEPEVKMGNKVLVKDVDFEYSYENNVKAGTANITVTGKGNYEGSVPATFKINPRNGSLFVYYLIFFDEQEDD